MKLKRLITATFAGLACLGTVLPNSVSADESRVQAKPQYKINSPALKSQLKKKNIEFLDISLTKEGSLKGVVFNKKRHAVAGATVMIRKAGKEIARTSSDRNGRFEIANLRAGTYHIIAGTGHGLFRVWTANAAPPKAFKSVKIMSDKSVVRGQDDIVVDRDTGEVYGQVRIYDGGGLVPVPGGEPVGFFNGGSGGLAALGVWDVVTMGASITALGFAIDNYNSIQDLEDRPVNAGTSN